MRNKFLPIITFVFLPLLMANSPSPEPYPNRYDDFTFANYEVEIVSDGTDKSIVFRGELTNTGTGIITLGMSNIDYYVSATHYYFELYELCGCDYRDGLLPNATITYEKEQTYGGYLSAGIRDDLPEPTTSILGFTTSSFLEGIITTDISIVIGEYDAVANRTSATISFEWDNRSEERAYSFYVFYEIGDADRTSYIESGLAKGETGSLQEAFSIRGDVAGSEVSDPSLHFLPWNSYYGEGITWSWGVFGTVIIGFLTILAMASPLIIVAVIFIVRAVHKRKQRDTKLIK